MTKAQIAAAIQAIVRLQLDDCKRAIKDGTKTIALNELEDAIRQLKLNLNTGYEELVVGQQLTRACAVVSITEAGADRGGGSGCASVTDVSAQGTRAALNSGPMRPVRACAGSEAARPD